MFESEADRLAMIKGAGGEEFDTGLPDRLWGIFDSAYLENGGLLRVANDQPALTCRTSDVVAHALVKDSRITRVADGAVYFVQQPQADGTGMTMMALLK